MGDSADHPVRPSQKLLQTAPPEPLEEVGPAASGAPAVDVALNANPSPLSPELTIAYLDDGGLATVIRAGFNVSRTRPRAAGATKVPSPSSWNYGNTLGHDP